MHRIAKRPKRRVARLPHLPRSHENGGDNDDEVPSATSRQLPPRLRRVPWWNPAVMSRRTQWQRGTAMRRSSKSARQIDAAPSRRVRATGIHIPMQWTARRPKRRAARLPHWPRSHETGGGNDDETPARFCPRWMRRVSWWYPAVMSRRTQWQSRTAIRRSSTSAGEIDAAPPRHFRGRRTPVQAQQIAKRPKRRVACLPHTPRSHDNGEGNNNGAPARFCADLPPWRTRSVP